MTRLKIERFADNGEFSHYDLIDSETGETLVENYKEKKYLWVNFKKTLTYSVGLEIGKEISREQADEYLQEDNEVIEVGELEILDTYSNDTYCSDSTDFFDVEFYEDAE